MRFQVCDALSQNVQCSSSLYLSQVKQVRVDSTIFISPLSCLHFTTYLKRKKLVTLFLLCDSISTALQTLASFFLRKLHLNFSCKAMTTILECTSHSVWKEMELILVDIFVNQLLFILLDCIKRLKRICHNALLIQQRISWCEL